MAEASQVSQIISLKILVDKENNRVVMAEADSDFVDILFSFLTMPMGTIVRLIKKQPQPATIGFFTSLYEWVENIEGHFLQTQACKSMLLHPRNPYEKECRRLKLNIDDTEPTKYYICADWDCSRQDWEEWRSGGMYSTFKNIRCNCGKMMDKEICMAKEDVDARPEGDRGVFVCGTTKFLVTDNLQVEPMSTAKILTLLHKLGLKDMSSLRETTLSIGSHEILNLLKGSLFSKTPLTDVFLRKQSFNSEGLNFVKEDAVQYSQGSILSPYRYFTTQDVTMKLMIDKSTNKALYAEVEEDMVDFLLSLLTFPLGSILRLLGGNSSLGSIDNLYSSVKCSKFMRDETLRRMLLCPRLCHGFGCRSNPLEVEETEYPPPCLWCFSYESQNNKDDLYTGYLTTEKSDLSISPSSYCFSKLYLVNPKSPTSETEGEGGFLKGPVTFVIMDNLILKPQVSFWSISFLKRLKVSLEDLEVREVKVRKEQALRLLKAFLCSKFFLTGALLPMVNFDRNSPKQEK